MEKVKKIMITGWFESSFIGSLLALIAYFMYFFYRIMFKCLSSDVFSLDNCTSSSFPIVKKISQILPDILSQEIKTLIEIVYIPLIIFVIPGFLLGLIFYFIKSLLAKKKSN